jgi:hypothetical protein
MVTCRGSSLANFGYKVNGEGQWHRDRYQRPVERSKPLFG